MSDQSNFSKWLGFPDIADEKSEVFSGFNFSKNKEPTSEENRQRLFETEKQLKKGTYIKKEPKKDKSLEDNIFKEAGGSIINSSPLGFLAGLLFIIPRLLFGNIILGFIFVPITIIIIIAILMMFSLIF